MNRNEGRGDDCHADAIQIFLFCILRTIWNTTDGLRAEKRGIYLERIVAWLQFRGGRFIDRDLSRLNQN